MSDQANTNGDTIDEEFNDIDDNIILDSVVKESDNLEPMSSNENQVRQSKSEKLKQKQQSLSAAAAASAAAAPSLIPDLPELTRKDKTLKEVLDMMDDEFAPIIPDAVTDYYLAKNGFESSDVKIKRLIALATQKFISDIAQDAYEYSRIRNSSSVYNSANPQVRAKQLLQGQQYANQQTLAGNSNNNAENSGDQQMSQQSHSTAGNQQGKVVLTMEDLSNALSEYGMNTSRPDFYR
ncbi:hypothetical protein KGF56_003176 [Candida oxycetoniae]|uniref:Transcription initiation factor TFIID subunit 10 n=1 Tax=Candida oxycetoniae TaxID=497107 RepID=A0AAI9WX98_9ASCO|nr:uncharacterized protein KGF56_003176 [Candida oxycetoniae]KAI3404017.1 hypothetical protein KGF56_003176 [Candida oxycetoniae]